MSDSSTLPVLVGIDGSQSALAAVRWAAIEAAHHHAPLHVVYAIGDPLDFGPDTPIPQWEQDYQQEGLDALEVARKTAVAASASIEELDITTDLVQAPPIPTLRDRSEAARLLVIGTRGLGFLGRGLLGSVSTALARHADCPVAVIPDNTAPADHGAGPVVVGVDGSERSAQAIEIAFEYAAQHGAELVAVHTWSEFFRYDARATMQEKGEELLSQSLAGYGETYPEVSVQRIVVEGNPAKRLLDAGEHAQLIVVGSHGRGGFAGMTLGSVSQAVLHAAQVPVVIARSVS
ncbi:universal stress protein [Nocardia sp. 004]|uniref:universal stress protein n=1 Tax=Nocardia sp. 004 TaxID=3385978 RepID=UPI00399EEF12